MIYENCKEKLVYKDFIAQNDWHYVCCKAKKRPAQAAVKAVNALVDSGFVYDLELAETGSIYVEFWRDGDTSEWHNLRFSDHSSSSHKKGETNEDFLFDIYPDGHSMQDLIAWLENSDGSTDL